MGVTAAALEIVDLFRSFRRGDAEVRALRGATLAVAAGETVTLTGPSGSGKSTLLACAAGLDEPGGGSVAIGGRPVTSRSEAERAAVRAREIGIVMQAGNLFGHLSLADNIRLQCRLAGRPEAGRVAAQLAAVGLTARGHALPATLSGGELARGALAVALVTDPPLLLADEPTAEVDAATEDWIIDAVERRRQAGGAALIATHSARLARRATRLLSIADGRVAPSPAAPRGPAPPCGGGGAEPALAPRGAPRSGAPVLVLARAVARLYRDGTSASQGLAPASFSIRAGDRIALMGPSGGGKTTLLSLIGGLDRPDGGAIAWPGLGVGGDAQGLRPDAVAVLFQSPALIPSLTAIENVGLPLAISPASARPRLSPAEALATFGLSDLGDRLPDELSGGQAQRVAAARALVTRPRLILADEPTGQLDSVTAARFLDDLLAATASFGAALVVATHDPAVARRLDALWTIDRGVLVAPEPAEAP